VINVIVTRFQKFKNDFHLNTREAQAKDHKSILLSIVGMVLYKAHFDYLGLLKLWLNREEIFSANYLLYGVKIKRLR